MNDDLTQRLPGDKKPTAPNDDRIGALIVAVQSLSVVVLEIKERLETLETTVAARSLETKPIWERALAEIAETRAELAETRAEVAETKAELRAEMRDGFRRLSLKIELLHEDSMTLRADQRQMERRVDSLESKTP